MLSYKYLTTPYFLAKNVKVSFLYIPPSVTMFLYADDYNIDDHSYS